MEAMLSLAKFKPFHDVVIVGREEPSHSECIIVCWIFPLQSNVDLCTVVVVDAVVHAPTILGIGS